MSLLAVAESRLALETFFVLQNKLLRETARMVLLLEETAQTVGENNESHSALLDRIEQIAKIFAVAMLLVLVAVVGWIIQTTVEKDKNALGKDQISLEYVKIAKEILMSDKELPEELVSW